MAAQWWPDPAGRFWVKGGVGIGSLDRDDFFLDDPGAFDGNNNYVYPSLFGAGGVEVVRSGRFTIDIQLRGAGTHQRGDWAHSVSVNVGLELVLTARGGQGDVSSSSASCVSCRSSSGARRRGLQRDPARNDQWCAGR